MILSNSYNNSFGKRAILTCQIKDFKTKEKKDATLYQYDTKNQRDIDEVLSYDLPFHIDLTGYKNLYLLKNEENDDIISYAQTSNHMRRNNADMSGYATLVEEMDANKDYVNPVEPLIAGIAKEARDRFHSSIFFAMEPSEVYALRKLKPTQASHGEHYIPATRFNSIIDKATEHSQIDFIA